MIFQNMCGITNEEGIVLREQNKKFGGIRYLPNVTKKELEDLARINRIFLNQMEMDKLARNASEQEKERKL